MRPKIHNFWDKYVLYYLNNFSSQNLNREEEGLQYLRDKLFVSILLIAFPLCVLTYIPSIIVCLKTKALVMGISDTGTIVILLLIFFNKRFSLKIKKLFFSVVLYLLSVIILISFGTDGPALFIMVCLSVMITLFGGRNAGLISVGINAVIFFAVLIVLPLESASLKIFHNYNLISEFGIGINILVFNTMVVLSAGFLVDHMNESFLKEKNLQELLKKESQELLSSKLKAEESDRLKTSFLANMSHEIRTPMNGILGFSYLLGDPGLSIDDRNEYIGHIQKSGDRLLNVINQIVEISKIESGLVEVNLNEVSINNVVESVYKLLNPEAKEKNLKFSFKTGLKPELAFIKTDRDKVNEILICLLKNAINFTNAGSIEFGYILRPYVPSGNSGNRYRSAFYNRELFFSVADTGIGIPRDRMDAIFNRFIKADIYDHEAREGVGLGLSIAKSYVEMLGGRIWVESELGKGSTFYFTIPCLIAAEPEVYNESKNFAREGGRNNKSLNVLIAEDDEISSLLLEQMVSKISNQTILAKNGIEAVEEIRRNPDIDLILMDIRMPGMDGLEATKQIRQFNTNVPIIAQTAFVMAGEMAMALEAGCNDFISKPIHEAELLKKIKLSCSSRKQDSFN